RVVARTSSADRGSSCVMTAGSHTDVFRGCCQFPGSGSGGGTVAGWERAASGGQTPAAVDVLILCTGNAARPVMAATSLSARRPDLRVATGGTLVVDGQPMSIRTRAAIEGVGLAIPRHASRQVHPPDLDAATLV